MLKPWFDVRIVYFYFFTCLGTGSKTMNIYIYIYIYIYTHDINASNHSISAVMDCNTGIRHSKRGNLELSVSLIGVSR